jgi:PhoD-like phosphatase
MTQILRTIKQNGIKNVVSITSDVHFSAAIRLNPDDAVFKDFDPFYEFVVGPMHAGAFGPNELEGTFGPSFEFGKSISLLISSTRGNTKSYPRSSQFVLQIVSLRPGYTRLPRPEPSSSLLADVRHGVCLIVGIFGCEDNECNWCCFVSKNIAAAK